MSSVSLPSPLAAGNEDDELIAWSDQVVATSLALCRELQGRTTMLLDSLLEMERLSTEVKRSRRAAKGSPPA